VSTDPRAAGERVKARALALGFDAVGIAAVAPLEAHERYQAWLAADRHGEMRYLASPEHRERRADPARILRDVRSVVCVALCHEPERDEARDRRAGRIARYAAGEDYHRIMRDKLLLLERAIEREELPGARALWYADTGAILERAWAERAGLGWIGKHSGLLSERLGSWFLLGEVLVDRALAADPPLEREHCGTCRRCIDACPTGDWIFGCDVCQEVCPWNRFAPPAREARLHARALAGWTLERFLGLTDETFDALFAGSPIRRARREGFLRNVCVALGNRGDRAAIAPLARTLAWDVSALVRGHAAWALGEIARRGPGAEGVTGIGWALERAMAHDRDDWVRDEARGALERCAAAAAGNHLTRSALVVPATPRPATDIRTK
jgi:epoxyqueuosine reductase